MMGTEINGTSITESKNNKPTLSEQKLANVSPVVNERGKK